MGHPRLSQTSSPLPGGPEAGVPPALQRRPAGAAALRWLAGGAAVLACALSCAHDARLEVPHTPAHAQLIAPSATRAPEQPELLRAEVELFGLPLGSLESSYCPHQDGVTVSTHVQPAALISALHRSGGDARTELSSPGQLRLPLRQRR
jgi:hypothetical protein